jgi:hypothetical protein
MISSLILILPVEVIIVLLELDHLLLSEVGNVVTTILSRRTSVVVSCIGSTTSPEASTVSSSMNIAFLLYEYCCSELKI